MGDVKVIFSAETSAAAAAIDRFSNGVRGQLSQLAATIGTYLTVNAFVGFVKGAIDAADESGKAAQKIGTSAEAFSAYSYAAKLADVDQTEFTIGMKTLAGVVLDAARGQTFAASTMRRLQVDIRNANQSLRTLDEILPTIADRFASMPDSIEKTDLAVQLFGRSGQQLIPLMNGGAEGLRKLADEARAAGVVISGESAQAAEEFNDTLTKVKANVAGLALSLAKELLPFLQAGADRLREFTSSAQQKQKAVAGLVEALKGLALVIAAVIAYVNTLGRQIGINLALGFEQITDQIMTLVRVVQLWYDSLGNVLSRILQLGLSLTSLGSVVRALASGDLAEAKRAAVDFTSVAGDAIKGLGTDVRDAFTSQINNVEGLLKRSATRAKTWWTETKENVLDAWSQISGTFSTLFGAQSKAEAGAGTTRPSSPAHTFLESGLKKETEELLQSINDAYRQAFFDKQQLLQQDYERSLLVLRTRIREEKNLTDEELANDEDFQIARYQLEQTYARKRAELERDLATQRLGVELGSNALQLDAIRGNNKLTEDEKLARLKPLLEERNRLLDDAIAKNRILAQDSAGLEETRLRESINDALRQQLVIQQEIADRERAINEQRLNGTRTMFQNMAAAAKAFGKEGFAAYKAFAIAAATIDTAQAAIAAYKSVVGIPYVGPILAPIAAAAAVAAGVAQIASISSQNPGFKTGGWTGDGSPDDVAGDVHRKEFVVKDPYATRARPLLEMINAGKSAVAAARAFAPSVPNYTQLNTSSSGADVNVASPEVTVVVVRDQQEYARFLESNAGKRIVTKHLREDRGSAGFDT